MIIEIDTKFLLDNQITAHQYIIVKMLSENQITRLKEYLNCSNSLDRLPKDLEQLVEANFVDTSQLGEYMNLTKVKVTKDFINASTFTSDPFDELYAAYPIKVLRPDGAFDYLRVDQERCRKLYHNIVRMDLMIHEHILRCLKFEVEDKTLKGQLTFMKRMPTWLTSEAWKVYDDHDSNELVTTQGEKLKAYGTNIE